jgi:hypothetical protein
MDNDIVTQLRAFISVANSGGDDLHAEHLREASDEIERLRLERDDYQERYRLAKVCLDFIYFRKNWWRN